MMLIADIGIDHCFNMVIGDGNFKNDMLCHYSLA